MNKKEIIDLHNHGFLIREIGEMYGVSRTAIAYYIKGRKPMRERLECKYAEYIPPKGYHRFNQVLNRSIT